MGPLLFNAQAVKDVAELGVALLLFSIGLEFSFKRLKNLGSIALGGGSLQVVVTMAVFAAIVVLFKPFSQALALGAITALSSTAVVLRILVDRTEVDAVHGRTALGILLLQDIAVVRSLAPQTNILVRGRFQRSCQELINAGANKVVDEEDTVGRHLANEALNSLELGQEAGLACALAGRSPKVTATPKTG